MSENLLDDFIRELPKIELHAHLNGSISPKTLQELMKNRSDIPAFDTNLIGQVTNFKIENFFPLFKNIYALTDNVQAIEFVTLSVLKEFSEMGCKYLELRSTPRSTINQKLTKEDYVLAVLNGIDKFHFHQRQEHINHWMIVRYIVSIDRRHSLKDNMETVELAIQYKHRGIVGADICGDPSSGSWDNVKNAILKAKSEGLKVTVHFGEIDGREEECLEMLETGFDRIGHGTYLSPAVKKIVLERRLPIEICMTSNILCQTVPTYQEHHLADFLKVDHPCILCTDDKGIFGADLVDEYKIAAQELNMNRQQLFNISYKSIDSIFDSDPLLKKELQNAWKTFALKHNLDLN